MKRPDTLVKVLAATLLIALPLSAGQQLTRDDYARAEQFLPWNLGKLVFKVQVLPHFIGLGDRFWYKNDVRSGKEFILVDPARNTKQPAFDHARTLSKAASKTFAADNLPFDGIEFVMNGRAIQFDIEKTRWTCDLATYALTKADVPAANPEGESLSPDGRWAAFIKDFNLYVRPTSGGAEVQLTTDGEPYYDYATETEQNTSSVTVRLSGRKPLPVLRWSPDSRKILTQRLDQRKVESFYLLQSVPPKGARPLLHAYRYALPGDPNLPLAELVVLDIESKTRTAIKNDPLPLGFVSPFTFQRAWWSADGQKVYFLDEERGCKTVRLKVSDALTGETRTLIEEKSATYVELNLLIGLPPNVRVLGGGAEIIWFSERDGWAHLYLYDGKTGTLKNQITEGPWVVRDILRVDEKTRTVYFVGVGRESGRDPYLQHLYRVKLDGSGLELLTPEDANHAVADPGPFGWSPRFSPSGRYFVDTFSRIDLAPVSVLRDTSGRLVRELERADVGPLLATGWSWPERFTVKARDGKTDLYGVIYKPSRFDPAKRYPVIDGIYPGPQAIRTAKSFGPSDFMVIGMDSALAELGFLVVTIDGLGTPFRSKAFHDYSYGRLEEAGGLDDHLAGIRQLAAGRPFMDIDRVGIWGHSGGGYASAHAILAYPDFYKVAVSSAGSHDIRSYIAGWGEQYQGLPVGDSYKAQANAGLAANLRGKLLLVCGDMDDNVHPALTFQVADALIKANKDFDLLVLPNRNHGYYREPYFIRRMWDYFVKNLLGAEPPQGYEITVGSPRK
jgi:dipeptidyl-peptidase-4